ncbi:STAS domain-containing protein [Actinomycetospora aeridis]|uniref:STAS domain-containing protein n=1 Tax=Actinomycetospora aeridis TaxID=3129231 RepID=A0ABU8N4J6_9PSEU
MTIDTQQDLSAPAPTVIDDVDVPADLADRRRRAVAEAVAHAQPAATGNRRAAVGIRRYGPGCVALALRGRFDRVGRERLRVLAGDLERQAGTELVIDLSGLEGCDPGLARVLARLRIRCLAREARVELHDPPEALAAELGQFRL